MVVDERRSDRIRATADEDMSVWWASVVECGGTIARLEREGRFTVAEGDAALCTLDGRLGAAARSEGFMLPLGDL